MIGLCAITACLALLIALFVGLNARAIGNFFGLLDFPDTDGGRKRHGSVTPLVGGMAVAAAVVVAALVTLGLTPPPGLHLAWLAGAVAVMFLIGAVDDRFHLSPIFRLGSALLVLVMVVSQAPDFSLMFLRFSGQDRLWLLGGWGDAFTLLCLLGLLNAVNLADGKNGIVIGMGLIWTLVLAAHAPAAMLPVLAAAGVALLIVGGFNMAGKLFLGDGGCYAISALFGLLAIYTYNHDFERMRADDVAVLFAIPVLDTIRLMATRVIQRRSPFEGDRDHLHHHLYARIGWPRGLWLYLAMVGLPNLAGLAWPGTGLVWLAVSVLIYVGVMLATRLPAGTADGRPAE
ncbi:MAG: undecaprenyl/decaprenyl-phosphate alpha-N-acetylglucosaminyl 1-phosphate transferase [Sandarakinorhabdus sp.]|nr:undecaprenyl/decaprenyl-phosphate alpha-N-acetylglucosaminyl 1-phosphate transferase [Sandarakinorhabdus sp.]